MSDWPMPLEWHPFYRGHTELLDWLEGRGIAGEARIVYRQPGIW